MASVKSYRRHSKLWNKPKNPFEKKRMEKEIILIVQFGLKNKRELWKIQLFLSKIRNTARKIIGIDIKHHSVSNLCYNIIWFCYKYNLIIESNNSIESILSISIKDLLTRRFQSLVYKFALSRTIHEARLIINHKYIEINGQISNKPGLLVKKDNEKYMHFSKKYLNITCLSIHKN
uniref:Ribosomal protein S9 n=1 Tax=Amorphochlora amoebiformis TaxID=1561963 RepID=A0A0H5BR03_9EUKA|nr:ribosomal protein S9 [Amorphochlora amoebiformis]